MTEMHSIFAIFLALFRFAMAFFFSSSRSSDQITVEGHITHLSHSLSSTTTSSTIDDEMFNSTDIIWKQMRFWVVVILRAWWMGLPFTVRMISTFSASNFNLLKMTFMKEAYAAKAIWNIENRGKFNFKWLIGWTFQIGKIDHFKSIGTLWIIERTLVWFFSLFNLIMHSLHFTNHYIQ